MENSEADFLKKIYREKSTEHLVSLLNTTAMSDRAFFAIRAVLFERSVPANQYPNKPRTKVKTKLEYVHQPQKIDGQENNQITQPINLVAQLIIGLPIAVIFEALFSIVLGIFEWTLTGFQCSSLHGGTRSPCGLLEAIFQSFLGMILVNVLTLGLPTILAYVFIVRRFLLNNRSKK